VQKPFIEQLKALGYQYIDPKELEREREGLRSVILKPRLKNAIHRLNSWLPEDKIDEVLRVVLQDLENPAQSDLVRCNEVVHSILVNGAKVQLDLGKGLRYYTIKLIDFENPEQNEFLVTDSLPKRSSFKVQGIKGQIKPDIVVFVNGIPLVVVEAKEPAMQNKDPIEEAISQLERYQKDAPQLFYPNLFVVATCGLQCEYAPVQGKFERWKDEEVEEELRKQLGRNPSSQEVFIACLFPKQNLLEFFRDFVAYSDEPPKGKVKKIARHMQWRAVRKAIQSAQKVRQRALVVKWLRRQAIRVIREKLKKFAEVLGVKPERIELREWKSKWGLCKASTGTLEFNWKLIQLPDKLIDYIVVHELAHLRHHGHDRSFWMVVAKVLPDWKQRHRELKEWGGLLIW